jgi:RND family efflux transporter MFP subunit
MDRTLEPVKDSPNVAEDGLNPVSGGPQPLAGAHGGHHVPVHYPGKTGARATLLAVSIVVAMIAVFLFRHISNARESDALAVNIHDAAGQPINVDVVHVQTVSGHTRLTLPGEARPFADSTVFARTSGYLSKYFVDIGDRVKEGQVLATIETPELEDQIAAAKAKIQELTAESHMAQTAATFAKTSYDRWQLSTEDGSVSVQERDQKRSELDTSTAKVEAAQASVALAEADLRRLLTMDKFKSVTAPYDGTITARQIDIGDLVTAGSTNNTTSLFSIAQSDQIRVLVDVPQSVAGDIVVGMPAASSFGGQDFAGHVDRTADTINFASRTLRVEVLVPNPKHVLLPGTYLQVTFEFNRTRPSLQVPSSSLVWRASGPQVAIVGNDDCINFHDVKIVRDSGDMVEVDGLNMNDRVALNLGSQAAAGEKVAPHDVDPPPPAHGPASTSGATAAIILPR